MSTIALVVSMLGLSLFIWANYGQGKQLINSQIAINQAIADQTSATAEKNIPVPTSQKLNGYGIFCNAPDDNLLYRGLIANGAHVLLGWEMFKTVDLAIDQKYDGLLNSKYVHTEVRYHGKTWIVNERSPKSDDRFRQILAEILATADKY